jgi:nucleotide-binding universal stress UspA family protein
MLERAMIVLRNILVATDFSEPSAVALAYGSDLARAYGATLHVLHVVDDVLVRYGSEFGVASPGLQQELELGARRQLDALLGQHSDTLAMVCAVRTTPSAAACITEYAAASAIDLIVVGTHGRNVVERLLMGSTAERVVRSAPCPVLAVRTHEREFISPDALATTSQPASVASRS